MFWLFYHIKMMAAIVMNGAIGMKLFEYIFFDSIPADMKAALLRTAVVNMSAAREGAPASAPQAAIIFMSPMPMLPVP